MTVRELFALLDEETAFEMWLADWEWEMLRNAALEELRNAGVGTMWGPVEELEWQALREEDERILVALRNGPPGVLWEQSGNEVAGGRARACGAAVAAAPGGWPRGQEDPPADGPEDPPQPLCRVCEVKFEFDVSCICDAVRAHS